MTLSTAPISPPRKASAPNTLIVVTKEDSTPGATSRAPTTAASTGARPACRWRAMFSEMTMASSINRPTAIRRPTMVIMSKEKPRAAMPAMVPMKATGSPAATQKE